MKTAFFVLNVFHCMTTCAGDTDFGVCPDLKQKDGMVDMTLSCGNVFVKACASAKGKHCTLQECKDHCAARPGCTTINYKPNKGACKLFDGCVGFKAYTGEGTTYFRKPGAPSCPSNTPTTLRTTRQARTRTTHQARTRRTTQHQARTRTAAPTTIESTAPPTTTIAPICPETCLGMSCDQHILGGAQTTCDFLETAGCDCSGCGCPKDVPTPSTTTTTPRNLTFAYEWEVSHGTECGVRNGSLLMSNVIHIGEDGKDFDRGVTPDDCRVKCGMHAECGGFTFHHLRQLCRYKHHQPGKYDTSIQSKFVSCYVYKQPIPDDDDAIGVKPITAEEVEEALGFGFLAIFVIVAVLAVLAGAAATVLLVIKRRQRVTEEVVVVRGLLVTDDDGPPAQTV